MTKITEGMIHLLDQPKVWKDPLTSKNFVYVEDVEKLIKRALSQYKQQLVEKVEQDPISEYGSSPESEYNRGFREGYKFGQTERQDDILSIVKGGL